MGGGAGICARDEDEYVLATGSENLRLPRSLSEETVSSPFARFEVPGTDVAWSRLDFAFCDL